MRRFLCLFLCILLLVPFVGCTVSFGDKSFPDIPFECVTTALVPRAEAQQSSQNEYYFFTSQKDLQKGLETLSANFSVGEVADGEQHSFETLLKPYTEDFFESKVLLFIKRYHSTEAVLQPQTLEAENNAFKLYANLERDAAPASVYRVYLLAFDKQYFLSSDATVDVETTSVEPPTKSALEYLSITVGDRYKTVTDDAAADEFIAKIRDLELTPSAYNTDEYKEKSNAITILGRGAYAEFTDAYILIGTKVYAPDSTVKQMVLDAYQTLPGDIGVLENDALEEATA